MTTTAKINAAIRKATGFTKFRVEIAERIHADDTTSFDATVPGEMFQTHATRDVVRDLRGVPAVEAYVYAPDFPGEPRDYWDLREVIKVTLG